MRHFTALTFVLLSWYAYAQEWMPVKMNRKLNYLHKVKPINESTKLAGITDSIFYAPMVLNFSERINGRFRTANYWGLHSTSKYIHDPATLETYEHHSFTRHANFWCKSIDSIGNHTWVLRTLDPDTIAFSTAWPAPSATTINYRGKTCPVRYASSIKDTLIDGVADSVLTYHLWLDGTKPYRMEIGKEHGLLRWRDVSLWTKKLWPGNKRTPNLNYRANWRVGDRFQRYGRSNYPFTGTFYDWSFIEVTAITTSGNTRNLSLRDSSVNIDVFVPSSGVAPRHSIHITYFNETDDITLRHLTTEVPDTAIITLPGPIGGFVTGNAVYKTYIPADTNKPWIVCPVGNPLIGLSYLATDEFNPLNYGVIIDGGRDSEVAVEGLGTVFKTGYSFSGSDYLEIMTCASMSGTHVGTCMVPDSSLLVSLQDKMVSQKLVLYPNPASTSISLETTALLPASYSILDAMGREVQQGKFERNTISIENLPAGVYKLRMAGSSSTFVKQ